MALELSSAKEFFMVRIGINGAVGKMGKRLVALAAADPELELVCALEGSGHPKLGADSGTVAGIDANGVAVTDAFGGRMEVLIDFSTADAAKARFEECVKAKTAAVIGTTGLGDGFAKRLTAASKDIAVVYAPNMSRAVNLMFRTAAEVAKRLGDGYDIEIIESHHRFKADSPSGTALRLAESICAAKGWDPAEALVHGRAGKVGARPEKQIGMHAVRTGDVVGEHRVVFGNLGERFELVHRAHTRDTFASGALAAAKFLAKQPPGIYTMADVMEGDA